MGKGSIPPPTHPHRRPGGLLPCQGKRRRPARPRGAVVPIPQGSGPRRPAYLTGSRHRLNKLQQLAIRLNIPGLASRHLPSEPQAGKGPELPGPAQVPHAPSPGSPKVDWPGKQAGRAVTRTDRRVRPRTASARRPGTARTERFRDTVAALVGLQRKPPRRRADVPEARKARPRDRLQHVSPIRG